MSGSEPSRLIAPLAVLLLLTMGCDASEQESTLPSDGQDANPAVTPDAAVAPATPSTIGDHVVSRARARAHRAYEPPDSTLPEGFVDLDYTAYRSIRFRPEAAIWRGETPFEVQLLPRGSIFRSGVRIHIVESEGVSEMAFDPTRFTFDGPAAASSEESRARLGYSGFRVHYPLNEPGVADEIAVFQGASYFRLVGPGQVHGVSARGLAIDIGEYGGEEFPAFTDFWLVRPRPGDDALVFHALLDGPSVTGAYRFELATGEHTVVQVDATVFARRDVVKLGIAAFSSMFLYGPNRAGDFDDFRPRVHDSDGLMMLTRADEWIWRPLENRARLHVTALRDERPKGFGLAQRARSFDDYLDLEAEYHRRPSAFVLVQGGDWGAGGVELLESPTDSEFTDNIAVSWVPDAPFRSGDRRQYRYRLTTFDGRHPLQAVAQVERTRIGWDALPGEAAPPPRSQRRIVVDFVGGPLRDAEPTADVVAVLHTTAGEISDRSTAPLPDGTGWRVSFRLTPDDTEPADMRLYLDLDGARASETWSYVWYPDEMR